MSLEALSCSKLPERQFLFKYCSTFDSTEKGSIGPGSDALLRELGTDLTLVCPALPANGRTIYKRHLFVGDQLLSESPMRNHPLTPMTDSSGDVEPMALALKSGNFGAPDFFIKAWEILK